jgi:hypothetical protein
MTDHQTDPRLFVDGDLSAALESQAKRLSQAVEGYDANKLLNTPVEDLCTYFVEQFRVEPINLLETETTTDQRETRIDVSGDRGARFRFEENARNQPATSVEFFVPFTGDAILFKTRPSTYTSNPPQGTIRGNELILTFVAREPQPGVLKTEFDRALGSVKQYASWVNQGVTAYNESLPNVARRAVDARRQRLLQAANMQASLGFPMKRRDGTPSTYSAPAVKRRLPTPPPTASSAPFRPEPALDTAEYEHILTVIQNMTLVLERSPSTFKGLDEEGIRQHFLVQLNGHYEGAATGETFNGEGKTDILIRQDGKNLFIAECKFWKGPATLTDAIDQLLSYTSWRDTKTALLVFVRDVAMSTVVAKVPEVLRQHSSFKRDVPIAGETRFRSVFGQPKDPSRELILTTSLFNVPH